MATTIKKDIGIIFGTFLIFGGLSLLARELEISKIMKSPKHTVQETTETTQTTQSNQPKIEKTRSREILEAIATTLNIETPTIERSTFAWRTETQENETVEIMLVGETAEFKKIPNNGTSFKIKSLLENWGFEVDVFNVAAGTIGGAVGYKNGTHVCLVTHVLSGYDPKTKDIPEEKDKIDMVISCGKHNEKISENPQKSETSEKPMPKETTNNNTPEKNTTLTNYEITIGENFDIELESNPTTGFRWIPTFDSAFLELVDNSFILNEQKNLAGAPGIEVFTFKGIAKGITEIYLNYERPWEEKTPEQEKVVLVQIN
jgi:inhibitor of cysteine peptidase